MGYFDLALLQEGPLRAGQENGRNTEQPSFEQNIVRTEFR